MTSKLSYLLLVAALASCTSGELDGPDTGKTPIAVSVGLHDAMPQTRAVNKQFETGDVLVAHLRHVTKVDDVVTLQGAFAKTVSLTMGTNPAMNVVDANTQMTTDFTASPALYWDDFSSTDDDIRLATHGLESQWGYCYNGNANAPATPTDVQAWSVLTDQSAGIKTSDLLWSATQAPVAYAHGSYDTPDSHGTLTIPYTHAMSKATLVITAGDGFGATPFASTVVKLNGVNTQATFTASTATMTGAGTPADITMHKSIAGATATFEAVFVPNTVLTAGALWATITDVEGNNYEVRLTPEILTAWAAAQTASGVNYKITATISKQAIDLKAQITDWTDKTATGEGEVKFATDLKTVIPSGDLATGTSYDVFRGTTTAALAYATTRSLAASVWSNSPEIYWANATTSYYFRGLAKLESSLITSVGGSTDVAQGTDLLWANTPAHTGKDVVNNDVNVAEGAAISPRTSHVPLKFEHVMSKVIINLTTTSDADSVDLTNATISIADMKTAGSVNVATGAVTGATTGTLAATSGAISIALPQTLTGKRLTIILQDGTTYSVLLTDCVLTGTGTSIDEWERGKSYTYTITLSKEAITFRALIKDWVATTGGGHASLDWD